MFPFRLTPPPPFSNQAQLLGKRKSALTELKTSLRDRIATGIPSDRMQQLEQFKEAAQVRLVMRHRRAAFASLLSRFCQPPPFPLPQWPLQKDLSLWQGPRLFTKHGELVKQVGDMVTIFNAASGTKPPTVGRRTLRLRVLPFLNTAWPLTFALPSYLLFQDKPAAKPLPQAAPKKEISFSMPKLKQPKPGAEELPPANPRGRGRGRGGAQSGRGGAQGGRGGAQGGRGGAQGGSGGAPAKGQTSSAKAQNKAQPANGQGKAQPANGQGKAQPANGQPNTNGAAAEGAAKKRR